MCSIPWKFTKINRIIIKKIIDAFLRISNHVFSPLWSALVFLFFFSLNLICFSFHIFNRNKQCIKADTDEMKLGDKDKNRQMPQYDQLAKLKLKTREVKRGEEVGGADRAERYGSDFQDSGNRNWLTAGPSHLSPRLWSGIGRGSSVSERTRPVCQAGAS